MNTKPHRCPHCPKAYSQAKRLSIHIQTHVRLVSTPADQHGQALPLRLPRLRQGVHRESQPASASTHPCSQSSLQLCHMRSHLHDHWPLHRPQSHPHRREVGLPGLPVLDLIVVLTVLPGSPVPAPSRSTSESTLANGPLPARPRAVGCASSRRATSSSTKRSTPICLRHPRLGQPSRHPTARLLRPRPPARAPPLKGRASLRSPPCRVPPYSPFVDQALHRRSLHLLRWR